MAITGRCYCGDLRYGFGGPQAAIWTADAQPFHVIPEGMRRFEGLPGR